MLAKIARRLCVGAVISSALLCNSATAVLIRSGNGNTTAPLVDDFGFANVGKSSTGNASVTYLGNRWVITAAHVSLGTTVSFDPDQDGFFTSFNIDVPTAVQIGTADLRLFRLTTDPGLPSLNIATTGPAINDTVNPLILVGNGLDRGATQHFWNALWQDVAPPGIRSGYDEVGGHTIRWGDNVATAINLVSGGTNHYTTTFDDAVYTGSASLTNESQATNGDSGGGVFQKIGGQWFLSGMLYERENPIGGQPASTSAFGNLSLIVDLSAYRSQILAITVPEPASISLALAAAGGLLWFAGRRARR